MSAAARTTEHVFFSGRVQGVGFRYTTRSIARRHPVTGYVKNLPDGRVELLAQGAAAAVTAFIDEVASHFRTNLDGVDRRQLPAAEEFAHFEIRY
jgi:acylphosphatase